MRSFFPLALAAAVAACASAGTLVDDASLSTLQIGTTTLPNVTARWGAPQLVQRLADGSTTVSYQYSSAAVKPASFIPIVGLVAGGTDVRSRAVVLRFDRSGILQEVSSHDGQISSSMGPAASK